MELVWQKVILVRIQTIRYSRQDQVRTKDWI